MSQVSPLINKNVSRQETHRYLHTCLVAHRGKPISFAMRDDGRIFYSVLDTSGGDPATQKADTNDKQYWSKVTFEGAGASRLHFPTELMQVGYSVVPNFQIDKYDSNNQRVINKYEDGKPFDAAGKELDAKEIISKTDLFHSSTARLGAMAPIQALSDGKYVYLFRQSISKDEAEEPEKAIVDNTLLVDRFILSGSVLKLSREIRYQRSRHKSEPESRKDTLSAVDMEGRPFYEPTRELVFANNLVNGNFSILLIPGLDTEEQRWQIFSHDSVNNKINSFNIRFDPSIVFDTSDSQALIDAFIEKYELDRGLIPDVQAEVIAGTNDDGIVLSLLSDSKYHGKNIPPDALSEIAYTIRTGVSKDDFILESDSEWPLIEYEEDGNSIKSDYLEIGTDILIAAYTFTQGDDEQLMPRSSPYYPADGLSSCYYYQQELGPDGKPLKNKAAVMLALGLATGVLDDSISTDVDDQPIINKYIGILNFSVSAMGQLSRLTTDAVNMPDINVQALDENPYAELGEIPTDDEDRVAWQQAQKMRLLDIDPNGLSTSGGVLKFAYTQADIGSSRGFSDAVVATEPYLFDDSLGRVNLYFKGKKNNFFVLYFNPTGSKSITISPTEVAQDDEPPILQPRISLKPRLDRDLNLYVRAEVPDGSNSCTLRMLSASAEVEKWTGLPRRLSQIAAILNGQGNLPLGTLEPLGEPDHPRAAYLKPSRGKGTLCLRTTANNNLLFKSATAHAAELADGQLHAIQISELSDFLAVARQMTIAQKNFTLLDEVELKADVFHRSYLSSMVDEPEDVDKLWAYLIAKEVLTQADDTSGQARLGLATTTATLKSLSAILLETEISELELELLRIGNEADIKSRLARLQFSIVELLLDVASIRIVYFKVQDTNAQSIDYLEAGLAAQISFDYANSFTATPEALDGVSATKWEHASSYLFKAAVEYDNETNALTEINPDFDYNYVINNAIGQWEDWEASLALELSPRISTDGAALYTESEEKIKALMPSEKGLSLEAWVKPVSTNADKASIIFYKNEDINYTLSLEKNGTDKDRYHCVATLGENKYTSAKSFLYPKKIANSNWQHIAFTHRKYWGFRLQSSNVINCGNDSSLQLNNEFSLEVLAKIDQSGTLLKKEGEYHLAINSEGKITFEVAGQDRLIGAPDDLGGIINWGPFYKITLIRSRNKPQTEPTKAEYPITGGQQTEEGSNTNSKWYEDMDEDEIISGMAEKQDQLDKMMGGTQGIMLGIAASDDAEDASEEANPKYYYTLIVSPNGDGNQATEWATETPVQEEWVETYANLVMGGGGFKGTFSNVRIWNRALSKREAKEVKLADNKTGLLSHWRMTEGKGKYLYDNVSENHGIAQEEDWTDSPQSNQPGQFQFYVNGIPEAHTAAPAYSVDGEAQFSLGGIKTGSSFKHHFKGELEEVRIWNLPRTNEQITDNAFGRLKGEWDQLLANYTFDKPIYQTKGEVRDSSLNSAHLAVYQGDMLKEVLSTAPIATEIPQVRSALTGVLTDYNGTLLSAPGVTEYGDVQKNDDGTLNGILKRCYSFIDADGVWNRMTGYKVGNLISQWFGQAQFAPQVMGYLEGTAPVPAENFPVGKDGDVDTYAYKLNNSVNFNQAEEVTYNYNTSKEAGWEVGVESEGSAGLDLSTLIAPLGFGISFKVKAHLAAKTNWQTTGKRAQSFERGTSQTTQRDFGASLAGYDNGKSGAERFYKLGNTGYALVKSKTADIYLLRLAHNNALVTISWQPNPDIPEDTNIIPFPINPLYTKQGTLDGKLGETTDDHYPQAHGAYGQYSYFKPRKAYQLKKKIEREKMELRAYFEDSFDVAKTNGHFQAAAATTGIAQLQTLVPVAGPMLTSGFNQVAGQLATQVGYNNTKLKDDLAKMGSQRNLVNTYVWTMEGGFYAESTEVAGTQQEIYSNYTELSLGGSLGFGVSLEAVVALEQKNMFSSGSSFALTKSKTKESKTSFGLDVNVDIPTSPRYQYAGVDGRALSSGLMKPGVVDAYRFMSFYLEPKGSNFTDLFREVIDPIWLDQSPDPNARALREARGNLSKAKPCWRIMHRVTYVSRVLPEFQPEAPPSLEKSLRVAGIESNFMLIKKFEPYVAKITDSGDFFSKIDEIIEAQLPEFVTYKRQIKKYLALYFNIEGA